MNNVEVNKVEFRKSLALYAEKFNKSVSTDKGEWIVKGFIDVAKNIYTVSVDTKVVSKIMELLLFPQFCQFAKENDYKVILCDHQNHYPDLTFIDKYGNKFAVDIKSTYRKDGKNVNGMTLGAFTGYFRERASNKNTKFPYGEYSGHYIFGLIYSRVEGIDEQRIYSIDDLQNITSVIKNFEFFVQEKYKIAVDRPGSGNTKNIGSVTKVSELINGTGPFSVLGEKVFDDYWMYYLTKDMARAAEVPKPPYTNLKTYKQYKKI
jgi:hypothetical protein